VRRRRRCRRTDGSCGPAPPAGSPARRDWCPVRRGRRAGSVPALQTGILYNHLYIGQLVWNRRRDLRDPDTGRSRHRVNPASEWVYAQAPHLRIIDDELWQAAKAKQAEYSKAYQDALAKGAEPWRAAASGVRPLTLLSGLIVCGVCGGTIARRGNNRLACVAYINGKGCSNASAVRGDSLETRVLVGLKDHMMAPDMMADAMRAFIEETNHLNQQRRASEGADRQRLEKARKAITSIVSAIEDGGLMERMRGLEAEVEALERALAQAPRDIPDVHPNVADNYRRKVEVLTQALNDPDGRAYRDPNGRFGGHLSAIHSACGFAGRSGVKCSAT
jgi:hypothetical protein